MVNEFLKNHLMKSLYTSLIFFISAVFLSANTTAQICGTVASESFAERPVGPNASCGQQSADFLNYYRHKENYIPTSTNLSRSTKKIIKLKLVVVNDPNSAILNFIDNSANRQLFQDWISTANELLETQWQTLNPQTNICGSCYIENTHFKYQIEDIQFTSEPFNINAQPDKDSLLYILIKNYGDVDGRAINSNIQFLHPAPPYIMVYKWKHRIDNDPNYNLNLFARHLTHEVGHLFGLHHLYLDENGTGGETCVESSIDYLLDIFNTGTLKSCVTPNNDYNCIVLPNSVCKGNYMDHKDDPYFSPMQLGRMHRESYLRSISRFCYPEDEPTLNPWLISSSQVWDFGIRMYQNIIVQSGNTLTIKCEVQMPPHSKIIVEKGAKLILDGGTITSYHPKTTWRGIELYGDKNAAPYPANQGSFEMKNQATIEYAMDGVRDFLDQIWTGGGIINVSNSTFKDCRRAVELNDYPNYARGTSCFFSNVKFIKSNPDAQSNQSADETGQFTAYNERGVLLSGCTFENRLNLNNIKNGKFGIYVCDAGFRVEDCSFKGYRTGVATTTVYNHPARTAKVINSSFDSLATGLLFANNFSYAQDNVFDHLLGFVYEDGMMAYYRNGEAAYVNNASGITLTRNTVNNTGSLAQRGFTSNDSRLYGTRFIDNSFNDVTLGVVTQRRNPTLDILCNHFNGGATNIAVNPQSVQAFYMLKDQGNGCDAYANYRAGNTFTSNTPLHIASYLIMPWKYYYQENNQIFIPANTTGTSLLLNSCEFDEDLNIQCSQPENVESWVQQHFDEAFTQWPTWNVGQQSSTYGLMVFSEIISALNERGSLDTLRTFFQAIDNNESKKMLLPLLLDAQDYSGFDVTLSAITWYDSAEQNSFENYYQLLRTLRQESRPLWQLSSTERTLLDAVAADSFEHSHFARAWKEFAFLTPWHHYQEQIPSTPSFASYFTKNEAEDAVSKLGDAVPNPAGNTTKISVLVVESDAKDAKLIVQNMLGQVVFMQKLTVGNNNVQVLLNNMPAGLYTYSLVCRSKLLQTKRFIHTN